MGDTDRSLVIGPSTSNAINHPKHYNKGNIEVIDFIDDQKLGFSLGNAVKYICRVGSKNPDGTGIKLSTVSDLKKAIWYIQHEIERLESNG